MPESRAKGDPAMRYVITVRATKEAGVLQTEEMITDMVTYRGELAKAGVPVEATGLRGISDT
jgi:hypothetical protein